MLSSRIRSVIAALIGLAVVGLVAVNAATPSPTAPPPGLSIAIDNGATKVAPDSDATYKVTFANAGTAPVTAWVVADFPANAKISAADDGKIDGHSVTWKATVGPGKKVAHKVDVRVGKTPKGTYRVTALASVYLTEDTSGAPLIRSADSDRIPGVAEPTLSPSASPASSAAPAASGPVSALLIGGGVVVLAVVAALVVLLVRRRSRSAAAATSEPEPPTEG